MMVPVRITSLDALHNAPTRLGEDPSDYRLPPEVVEQQKRDYRPFLPMTPGYPHRPLPPPEHTKLMTDLDLSKSALSESERNRLQRVLLAHTQAFAKDDFDLGETDMVEHVINTEGNPPLKSRPAPSRSRLWSGSRKRLSDS